MEKEAKTARELADTIRERLDMRDLRVAVFYDKNRGWYAVAYSSPETVAEKQLHVDRVVEGLRIKYELKD